MLVSDFDNFEIAELVAGRSYLFHYNTNSGEVTKLDTVGEESLAMALDAAYSENDANRRVGYSPDCGVIMLDGAGYFVANTEGHVINFASL